MKKLACMLCVGVVLLGLASTGLGQATSKDLGDGVVGVRVGSGLNVATRILRLEYQLRILAVYHSGGLTVSKVFPGGPATQLVRMGSNNGTGALEPGDLITHVNGERITSQNDYYLAMYQAGAQGGRVVIRVRDVQTGRYFDWETTAEPVGDRRRPIPRDGKPATKVKALLIGDTDDRSIGERVHANLQNLEGYVRGLPNFNANTDLVKLTGRNVTAQNILATVRRLRVEPTETLFCYVASHGAYDPRLAAGDPSGGHFFQLKPDLMRKALLAALQERGGQLTVLITDTCNTPASYQPPMATSPLPPLAVQSKLLADLLFNHVGLVDLSGSSRGQYGWYLPQGGVFTLGLLETLRGWDEKVAADWKAFHDKASATTNATYQALRKAQLARPAPTDAKELDIRQHVKCPDKKEDAISEVIALAWKWYCRLVQQGKDPATFVSALAGYAARAVHSGRQLCGKEKAMDVLSPSAQRRRGFAVESLPAHSSLGGNPWDEALRDNMQSPIPDQVCFRCDFPNWRKTRSDRDRRVIDALMVGERTLAVARKYGLTPSRVSQLRREFATDWERFCAVPEETSPQPTAACQHATREQLT